MTATLIIAATQLTACSTISAMVSKGAELNDAAVQTAEFTFCQGASIGALRRKFNPSERAALWKTLKCPEYEQHTAQPASEADKERG